MKKYIIYIMSVLVLLSCSDNTETVYKTVDRDSPDYVLLSGLSEKGPCNKDSDVLAFPLYNGFNQTGAHYLGGTKTDLGYWEVPAEITEDFIEVNLEGTCFNERYGSSGNQELSAIIEKNGYRNINPLTTIAVDVIRWIYNNQAVKNESQATIDAEDLVSSVFGFTSMSPFSSIALNDGDDNAAKLAIASSVILQARSDQSDFMIEISQAIINSDTTAIELELSENIDLLPVMTVNNNLKSKYSELGVTWNYPPMHTISGLPDYYGDLIGRIPATQISHNMDLTGMCSFDQSTFNTFATPIVFESGINTSVYFSSDFPSDAEVSIWTKSSDAYPSPETKIQDLTTLREQLLNTTMLYHGMFDQYNMPVSGTEYFLVIRKDTDFTMSKSCDGPVYLPFGQVLASDDEMVSWIGFNNTTFFTYDIKYATFD